MTFDHQESEAIKLSLTNREVTTPRFVGAGYKQRETFIVEGYRSYTGGGNVSQLTGFEATLIRNLLIEGLYLALQSDSVAMLTAQKYGLVE